MNSLVSIVVLTCGRKDYVFSCVESIHQQTYAPLEVILIDNSPHSVVAPVIRKTYPLSRVCALSPETSYCDAMNKGIEMSRGEFILCLNDDAILDTCFVGKALKGFAVDKSIGMVSGKILRQDKRTIDSTGLFVSCFRTARERGYGKPDMGQFEKAEFIFGVSGAVAFYCKAMLDEIREGSGWFDSRFRFFYEDLDLAWRGNRYGWRAYYIPDAVAYHVRGGSVRENSGQGMPFARQYLNDERYMDLVKNRYLTMIKNESFAGFIIYLVPVFVYDCCAWIYMALFRPKVIGIFLRHPRR